MLLYTLWNACEFIFVYFVYVETKGPTLEEIARIFDGPRVASHPSPDKAVDREAHSHDRDYASEEKAA